MSNPAMLHVVQRRDREVFQSTTGRWVKAIRFTKRANAERQLALLPDQAAVARGDIIIVGPPDPPAEPATGVMEEIQTMTAEVWTAWADSQVVFGIKLLVSGTDEVAARLHGSNLEVNRRLVAGWNATEGVSTEALEAGFVRELLAAARQTIIDQNSSDADRLAAVFDRFKVPVEEPPET